MKKIMFNTKYGLEQAVLSGTKTMTRRLVPCNACNSVLPAMHYQGLESYYEFVIKNHAHYDVGEEVAVAQSYHALNKAGFVAPEWLDNTCEASAGYENKMFVRADLMPHRIRITDIKIERLQDISNEDCLREGIIKRDDLINSNMESIVRDWFEGSFEYRVWKSYATPREAFARLIDKVSGNGTWNNNPFVFVYSFELIC